MSTYSGSERPGERARIFAACAGAEGSRYLTASTLVVEVDAQSRRGLTETHDLFVLSRLSRQLAPKDRQDLIGLVADLPGVKAAP